MDRVFYSVRWGNPYTAPPSGLPVVFALAPDYDRAVEAWQDAPSGYAVCVNVDTGPVRRLSPEAREALRRKRLVRRIERKYPLFAAEFVAQL
jgi:hypothetical protein